MLLINNQIVSYDEKYNIQKSVFEDVDSVYKKLVLIAERSAKFGVDLPMPSYTNFRDALFHYAQIHESSDVFSMFGNTYALREHLQRSVKDAWVSVLNQLSNWIEFFCIKNNMNKVLEDEIKCHFPDFTDIGKWSITLFKDVRNYLKSNTEFGLLEINYFCLIYCTCLVQNENVEYITELRHRLHNIKNFSHKMRSASSNLIKTYTDDDDFQDLLKELDDLYIYMYSTNIYHSIYFAVGVI